MIMKICRIKVENCFKFYGYDNIDITLGNVTEITGVNESGKSTIKKIIQWLLNCKDENGKEITGIRPHDLDGNDINSDDCIAEMEIDIDGSKKVLKKVLKYKKNKKGDITGTVTECYINDILKKATDYGSFLQENIGNISYCINAMTLLRSGYSDQRSILNSTFSEHEDSSLCECDEFSELKSMLEDGTINELKDRCSRELKKLKADFSGYRPRIEELEKQKVDIDVSELELRKNEIKKLLDENAKKQTETSALLSQYDSSIERIMEIKFRISELQNEENEKARARRKELEKKKGDIINEIYDISDAIQRNKNEVIRLRGDVENMSSEKNRLSKLWMDVKAEKIPDVCPTCGRPLSDSEDFLKSSKEKRLKSIEEEGLRLKNCIEKSTSTIKNIEQLNIENDKRLSDFQSDLISISKEIESIGNVADIDSNEEVISLREEMEELQNQVKENELTKVRSALKEDEQDLMQELSSIDSKIQRSSNNIAIDERIEQILIGQRETQQKIADQERITDLLREFSLKKNKVLEEDVNKHLSFCNVELIKKLKNGELEECCNYIHDGESYYRNLNHGARMLTEMDICMAFQKKLEIRIPIIIDDAESVDGIRIPDVDNQLIILKRTDDEELKVINKEG